MNLYYGTNVISEDEPCLGLHELNFPCDKGQHRYQIAIVVRDDKPSEYRLDMGSTKLFKGVDQFRIPGGVIEGKQMFIELSVGELREIAERLREKNVFDKQDHAMDKNRDKRTFQISLGNGN